MRTHLDSLIHGAIARTGEAAARRREKLLTGCATLSATGLFGLWQGAHSQPEAQRSTGAATGIERQILLSAYKRHNSAGNDPAFIPMMEWCVGQWAMIMGTKFRGMVEPPRDPSIRFFVKLLPRFIEAYRDRDLLERFSRMTTREQMIHQLVAKGRDQQAAEREVDERLGLLKLKQEIEAERKQLQILQRQSAQYAEQEKRVQLMERHARRTERRATRLMTGEGGTFDAWK